ncbi:MAG: transposase [Anaerolineae bacterium]|jgi:transposase-like protein|nr:transposase [Anaerolineae bacterium]MBT7188912.1 transposase [Anaerolineae bacterium]
MSGKKGMKHYPKEVKLEAVRMFFEEDMTRAEIMAIHGVFYTGNA